MGGALRLTALWVALVALLAASRPTPAWWWAGLPCVTCGEALRLWAAGHLRKTVILALGGPYRHTRNPLYLGRLLIFSGLALTCPLPRLGHLAVLALGWALFFGVYLPRKERVEPARLAALHGARYARYRAAVPALWPRLQAYCDPSLAGPDASEAPGGTWSVTRALGNREHWMVAGLAAVLTVQALRAYGLFGPFGGAGP